MRLKCSYHNAFYDYDALKLLSFVLFFAAGTYGIKAILYTIGLGNLQTLGSFFIYIIWGYILLKFVLKNLFVLRNIFFYEIVYIVILVINYFIFKDTVPYYIEYSKFLRQIIFVYIPAGAIAVNIIDYSDAYAIMKKTGIFGSFFMLMALMLGYTSFWDYQYFGVQTSPFALLMVGAFLHDRKISSILICVMDVFMVFFGGRQSLIVLIVGVFLIYYFHIGNRKKRILFIIGTIVCSFLFLLIMPFAIEMLITIAKAVNLDTRTLDMLANGELTDISTRTIIYEKSIEIIRNNGTAISGLFADRFLLRNSGTYMAWIAYPHNIILELLIDFGMIVGTIIIILNIFLIFRQFTIASIYKKSVLGLFFSLVVIRLLVSSSFMIEGLLYVFIGLIFSKRQGDILDECS